MSANLSERRAAGEGGGRLRRTSSASRRFSATVRRPVYRPRHLTATRPSLPCGASAAVAQGQSTPLVIIARPSGNRRDCTIQIRGKLRAQCLCRSRAKPGMPGRCRGQTDGAFAASGGMVKGWSRPQTPRGPRKRWRQEGWGREFDSRRRHQNQALLVSPGAHPETSSGGSSKHVPMQIGEGNG